MRARRGRKRGKTLLELIVVLTIIAALLAICMPYYVKAIRKARAVAGQER